MYDTFYLYTTCSFLKKELYAQVFPTTIAHRLFRIFNIITPLVVSRDTADEQFTLEITCHIDERTPATYCLLGEIEKNKKPNSWSKIIH